MGFWTRLGIAAMVSLAAGAVCWALLYAAGTDPAIASGTAAALATVIVTLGGVWASRSPSPQGESQAQASVFGSGSDFTGARITIHSPPASGLSVIT